MLLSHAMRGLKATPTLHSAKQTCNLKRDPLRTRVLFKGLLRRFQFSLRECSSSANQVSRARPKAVRGRPPSAWWPRRFGRAS